MKILLVAPVFRPSNSVAAQRMNFLFDMMKNEHSVEVLVLSDITCLDGKLKTIDKSLFATSHEAWRNKAEIYRLLHKCLCEYDLVIVSLPDYGLLEVVKICNELGINCVADLRDQPNLSAVQNITSSKIKNVFVRVKNWLQVKYVYQRLQYADYITVVGSISTSMVEFKSVKPVVNVNNGYLLSDKRFVSEQLNPDIDCQSNRVVIGWVGNIHRFRDNVDLRITIEKLNSLARSKELVLKHWGKCCPELEEYIRGQEYLVYEQTTNFIRKDFLTELNNCNCFLLSCSDSLIWEPTTSVFDYLLFNKPVIYSGLKNNEAFNILFNSGIKVLTVNTLEAFINNNLENFPSSFTSDLYSREYAYTNLKKIIDEIQP